MVFPLPPFCAMIDIVYNMVIIHHGGISIDLFLVYKTTYNMVYLNHGGIVSLDVCKT